MLPDKIVTVSNNRPEWNFVDMGMAMLGIIHVPVFPSLSSKEYSYILKHSDAKLVIVANKKLSQLISEAKNEEAQDYVFHFCGIDCFAKWKEQAKNKEE